MNYARLTSLIELAGYAPVAYSGRGMFGKRCVGLTTDSSLQNVLADLVTWMHLTYNTQEIAELIRDLRCDSMGRGIVVYWPSVAWQEDAGSEDE